MWVFLCGTFKFVISQREKKLALFHIFGSVCPLTI